MIRLDDKYCIKVDEYNYILQKIRVAEKGNNVGKEYYTCVGYFHDLVSALKAYHRECVREGLMDDFSSLSEAFKTILETDRQVEQMIQNAIPEIEISYK